MAVLANVQQFLSGTRKDTSSKPPYLLKQRSSKFIIVLTVSLAIFTDIFFYALVIPVIPFSLTIQVGIPADQVQRWTSLLLACYSLALLVGSPLFGLYADHSSSRRWPLLIGLVMLAASTLLLCLGNTISLLVVGRLLQGLSAAIVWSVGCALLVDTMGDAVGVALGYVNIAMSLGLLVAPAVGGAVYEADGYYAVFYIAFGIVAVDIVLRLVMIEKKVARQWVPEYESEPAPESEHDVEKATPSVAAETDAVSDPREPGNAQLPPPIIDTSTEVSTQQIGSDPVPRDEGSDSSHRRARNPSAASQRWRKKDAILMLVKSSRLLASLYGIVVEAGLMMGFDATLALFLQTTFNWTSTAAGLLFLAIFLPGFVSPLAGMLSDRYGARWPSFGGFCASVPLLICLRFVDANTTSDKILLGFLLGLLGCAFTFSNTPLMAEVSYVIDALAAEHPGIFGVGGIYGLGYGLWTMAFALGGTVGPLWAGYVLAGAGWGTMTWSFGLWAASAAGVAFFGLGQKTAEKTTIPQGEQSSDHV